MGNANLLSRDGLPTSALKTARVQHHWLKKAARIAKRHCKGKEHMLPKSQNRPKISTEVLFPWSLLLLVTPEPTFSRSTRSLSSFFCTNWVTQSGSPTGLGVSGVSWQEDERNEGWSFPPLKGTVSVSRTRASSWRFFCSKSRSQERAPQIRLKDFP